MPIFIFKSETNDALYAFAGDREGSKLPVQFAPWQQAGTVRLSAPPPHNFSRFRIESAIKLHGFQLWRIMKPAAAD
jgi:hypothetical protein